MILWALIGLIALRIGMTVLAYVIFGVLALFFIAMVSGA